MAETIHDKQRKLWAFVYAQEALRKTGELIQDLNTVVHLAEMGKVGKKLIKEIKKVQRQLTEEVQYPLRVKMHEKEMEMLK